MFTIAFACAACEAYDARLIRQPDPGGTAGTGGVDGGRPDAGEDGGADEDGGVCISRPERCNRSDDDCDGTTDEDTVADCERTVLNAQVQCAPFGNGARCVAIECLDGYDNCDGDPTNGCERPYCDCNPCEDAGAEDAGAL